LGIGVRDNNGRLLALEGTIMDNDQYKKAEFVAKQSESRFTALFNQASVGIAEIDSANGRFLQINQYYSHLLGYSIDEMLKLDFQTITYTDDLGEALNNMTLLTTGEIRYFSMQKRYLHKDGNLVWVRLTVTPLWKIGEQPSHHMAIVEDITAGQKNTLNSDVLEKFD